MKIPRFAFSTLVLLASSQLATAQAPAAAAPEPPKVTVLQPGVDRLLEDLEFMVAKLGGDAAAWKNKVEPNLKVFMPGIDTKRPIRVDVILDPNAKKEQYRTSFPVNNLNNFLQRNLKPLGVNYIQIQRNFYKLTGAYIGFARYEENAAKEGYANFAEDQKLIPLKFDPMQGVNLAAFANQDWIVGFENDPNNPAGMADRAKSMTTLKTNLMAGIVKKKDESEGVFNLRKIGAEQQLEEIERFFAESAKVGADWNTDIKTSLGKGNLTLSAIPGTSLEKSIDDQAAAPSKFATMAIDANAASALRVNFALDDLRIKHLTVFYDALRKPMEEKIPSVQKWDDAQKEAAKSLGNKFLDMLKDGLTAKVVDGFYDAHAVGDSYEVIGGFLVTKPDLMKEMVQDYPKLEKYAKTTMNVDTESGVEIHKVEVDGEISPGFASLFGTKAVVFIGTGKDTVWFSVGENTLAKLKESIKKVSSAQAGPADGRMIYYHAHLLAIAKAVDAQSKNKDTEPFRKQMVAGLAAGDDYVQVTLDRKEKTIVGVAEVRAGLLAAIGRIIAEFANSNL